MSNTFQSVSAGLAQLKNYYQGPIVSQFNDETKLYRGAEKGKHSWSGLQVIRPWKVRRNQGIGATADGGTLPAIGRQTTVQAIIAAKYNYLRFGITGPMIKASASDVGSFVRSAAFELQEGYKDLQSDVNRQLGWDGSGTMALLNASASSSSSIVLKGRSTGEPALKFIDIGAVLDLYNGSSLVQSGIEVTAITAGDASSLTATVTVSPAVATGAAGYAFVRANSYGQEAQGVLTQLDGATTTVFNVDRSLYPAAQGNYIDAGGTQLTLDKMQQAYNEALRRGAGKLDAIYTDFNSLRMYQKLLTADKRYVNTVKGDGGFSDKEQTYMDFNGIPVIADKDFSPKMLFIPSETIVKYVLAEMEFADETGSMYIAQTSADAFETRVRLFFNMFNEKPAASALLTNYISP